MSPTSNLVARQTHLFAKMAQRLLLAFGESPTAWELKFPSLFAVRLKHSLGRAATPKLERANANPVSGFLSDVVRHNKI